MPFKFSIVSDVREVLRGNEAMEKGFDDTADSLDDLAREAQKSGKQIGEKLDDAGDEAGDAADKIERKFREAFKATEAGAKTAGDEVGDKVKHGAAEAEEGIDTLRENGASNAKELGASFDGSIEGMVDGLQGFVAEATEGFGTVGLVGGVALAAAIGIGMSALQNMAEAANEVTEKATEMQSSLSDAATEAERAEVFSSQWDDFAAAVQRTTQWYDVLVGQSLDRPLTNIENLSQAAEAGAVNVEALYDAFTDGDPTRRLSRLNDVLSASQDRLAELRDIASQSFTDLPEDIDENVQAVADFNGALQQEIQTAEAAVAIEEALAAAKGLTVEQYRAEQEQAERSTDAQESFNSAIEAAGDSVDVYEGVLERKAAAEGTAVEDTTASVDDMIAEWNRQAEEAEAFEGNLAIIAANGGQTLADELRAKGPEAAAATAEVLAQAGGERVRAAAEAHGRATGQAVGSGTAQGITDSQGTVNTSVELLRQGIRTPAPIPLTMQPDFTDAERQINEFTGRRRFAQIVPRLGEEGP